ncbi:hypothetical protein B9Z55_007779 [Caenorhabditis nigoni]|nr:hypothetical protein B9Z55_007779 [Caenorhabditis nigoni]
MITKEISYKSGPTALASNRAVVLETGAKDGIKHTWRGFIKHYDDFQANLTWKFDWEDLKRQGFDRLVGHLIVNSVNGFWNPERVDIDWTDTNQSISKELGGGNFFGYVLTFEYNLTAHYSESPMPQKSAFGLPTNIFYDKMFVASDKTDGILNVEGKKLNVNKTFLSFHSDYFSTLFSSNFKERQMKEIEIKEVSYDDFGLLLSSFYPNPQFPNDHTVEKLLEMASRFQVSSVVGIVEYHLLNNSKIGYEKMLWMADEYGMPKLLEKCISQMNSLAMAKKLEKSPEFEKLSDRTSSLILRRLLKSL